MDTKEIKEVLDKNPAVDREKFEAIRESLKTLRSKGVKGASFNIVLPFNRPASALRKA